jgi:hypothetical protein
MASRISDMLIMFLPGEWRIGGIAGEAASPGPLPPPPGAPESGGRRFREQMDLREMRMIAQLMLARLGGPVTLGEMEPRSVGELNELETRLTSALEEIRNLRAELEKS